MPFSKHGSPGGGPQLSFMNWVLGGSLISHPDRRRVYCVERRPKKPVDLETKAKPSIAPADANPAAKASNDCTSAPTATKEAKEPTSVPAQTWTPEQDAQLLALKEANQSWKAIAATMSLPKSLLQPRYKELRTKSAAAAHQTSTPEQVTKPTDTATTEGWEAQDPNNSSSLKQNNEPNNISSWDQKDDPNNSWSGEQKDDQNNSSSWGNQNQNNSSSGQNQEQNNNPSWGDQNQNGKGAWENHSQKSTSSSHKTKQHNNSSSPRDKHGNKSTSGSQNHSRHNKHNRNPSWESHSQHSATSSVAHNYNQDKQPNWQHPNLTNWPYQTLPPLPHNQYPRYQPRHQDPPPWYPPPKRLVPDETWSREDCDILEQLEARHRYDKWLTLEVGFYNWTGRKVRAEVIEQKMGEIGQQRGSGSASGSFAMYDDGVHWKGRGGRGGGETEEAWR